MADDGGYTSCCRPNTAGGVFESSPLHAQSFGIARHGRHFPPATRVFDDICDEAGQDFANDDSRCFHLDMLPMYLLYGTSDVPISLPVPAGHCGAVTSWLGAAVEAFRRVFDRLCQALQQSWL